MFRRIFKSKGQLIINNLNILSNNKTSYLKNIMIPQMKIYLLSLKLVIFCKVKFINDYFIDKSGNCSASKCEQKAQPNELFNNK